MQYAHHACDDGRILLPLIRCLMFTTGLNVDDKDWDSLFFSAYPEIARNKAMTYVMTSGYNHR